MISLLLPTGTISAEKIPRRVYPGSAEGLGQQQSKGFVISNEVRDLELTEPLAYRYTGAVRGLAGKKNCNEKTACKFLKCLR